MNKAELVEKVAGEVGLTKKDVNNVVDAVTSVITDSLAGAEKVTLVGFGTFQIHKRKARRSAYRRARAAVSILEKDIVGNLARAFLLGLGILTRKGKTAVEQAQSSLKYAKGQVIPVPPVSC